ncbi:BTAD domain-containing putative transcriptional regulator [Micromonospora musae]|uniref:AfsR/SARP family transcriptional regulator n=1 Tax=Micromonospora musae TaxID=1894970 RepID=UPI0034291F80
MRYQLLGPVRVRAADGYRTISGARQRRILAALLVDANRVVSVDRLVDVVWGEQPPATSVQQVQNCVSSLRRMLVDVGHEPSINRMPTGYSLSVRDDAVDTRIFTDLVVLAERSAAKGDTDDACTTLRRALGLWHGRAMEDVSSDALTPAAVQLDEARVRTMERLVAIEMTRGRADAVLGDLSAWAREQPYHEGLHGQLALAYHTVGRTGDALTLIDGVRRRLRTDLGIDLGAELSRVEAQLRAPRPDAVEPERVTGSSLEMLHAALVRLTAAVNLLTRAIEGGRLGQGASPSSL